MISGKVLLLSALVFVFVYKLAFLTKDIISSKHRLAIYRDQEGVPHVYSHTKKDVYFGMGYAQGQDKLWTLFLKRIFIQGRLAELFG